MRSRHSIHDQAPTLEEMNMNRETKSNKSLVCYDAFLTHINSVKKFPDTT